MKTSLFAVLAAAVSLAACSTAPKAAPMTCGAAPSSYLTDDKGVPTVAIYTCYREDGLLAYQARKLAPEQIAAARAAIAASVPNASPADPCSDLKGKEYTRCRIGQKAAKVKP